VKGKKKTNLKSFVIALLRRGTFIWPARNEALKAARIDRGLYKCNLCKGTFRNKEIRIDHVEPVVPVTGFTNWDDYINRMFCESDGLQVVCMTCHDSKSMVEKELRKINRKKVKQKRKKD
jgi:hypothetical protein